MNRHTEKDGSLLTFSLVQANEKLQKAKKEEKEEGKKKRVGVIY